MFFVILICLGLERFFSVESLLQRQEGFNYYFSQIKQLMPLKWQHQPYSLLLFLLPAVTFVFLLHTLSAYYFSRISILLLEATTLFYCLGPCTLYHKSIDIPENLFEKAHASLFSVFFWFVLLGPVGALLFRLLERIDAMESEKSPASILPKEVTVIAKPIVGYLSWLPIRFFIAIQAILGKFPDTLRYWLDHLLTGWTENRQFTEESGRIALGVPLEALLEVSQYKKALNLFDKILLIFLGMISVYTLFAWVV